MLETIWLIPVFPFVGAAFQFFFGRRVSNKAVSLVSVGLPSLSFLWALGCFIQFLGLPESAHHIFLKHLYTWLPAGAFHLADGSLGNLTVNVGIQLDPLSCVMLLVVTGVGFLIHVYSIGYMAHEGGLLPVFWVHESLHVFDAGPGAGGQLSDDVRGLGGRWPLFLSADRLLSSSASPLRMPAKRPSSSTASGTRGFCWESC